jgi:hypothetical protein
MEDPDNPIPAFLRGPGTQALGPARRRWKKLTAQRPEGDRWANAERWEVYVDNSSHGAMSGLGGGTRRVWVLEGHKWAHLRDSEGYAKIAVSEWRRMARNGRSV